MKIPWQALSADALDGLIEEYVTRDGTDYGEQETSLERRKQQVMAALRDGRAVILFTQSTGQSNIISADSLPEDADSL